MEIELTTKEGDKVTIYNIDFIEPTKMINKKNKHISVISSGGKTFEVVGSYEEIKEKIRNSNLREASLIFNL